MYRQQYTLNYQQFPSSSSCGFSNTTSLDESSLQNVPETHKSMWVINPLYTSSGGMSDGHRKDFYFENMDFLKDKTNLHYSIQRN